MRNRLAPFRLRAAGRCPIWPHDRCGSGDDSANTLALDLPVCRRNRYRTDYENPSRTVLGRSSRLNGASRIARALHGHRKRDHASSSAYGDIAP
jgi:hypothetical protein